MKTEWQRRWVGGRTGWDLGRPHQQCEAFVDYIRPRLGSETAQVLVPGCGRGHEAAFFADKGYKVTAADYVDKATEAAKSLYDSLDNLQISTVDCLQAKSFSEGQFDLIVDRAMLCALEPQDRGRYLENCDSWLKPGGYFCTILFTQKTSEQDAGPPFRLGIDEFCGLLPDSLLVRDVFEYPCEDMEIIATEARVICQKMGGGG